MKGLLHTPYIPSNNVTAVLVSDEYPEIIERIENELHVEVIRVKPNIMLEPGISSHPDCVFFQLNHNTIITDLTLYEEIVNYFTSIDLINELRIVKVGECVSSPYPDDVKLNARLVSGKIICNRKYADQSLINAAYELGYDFIHCNQGYAACSTINISDTAIITDDESIYSSVNNYGIDCLLIRKGSVQLKNHNYGFIGGCCGMIDKDLIAFTGRIESHRDGQRIIEFLNKYGINYINLLDGPLIDIGGIIPVTELI